MIFARAFLLLAITLVTLSALWSGGDDSANAPSQCASCTMVMVLDDLPDDAGNASAQATDISADPADPFAVGALQASMPDARAELTVTPPLPYKLEPARVLLRPPRLA